MNKTLFYFLIIMLGSIKADAYMLHHYTSVEKQWSEEGLAPFTELMLTWNAERPQEGKYHFYISVKTDDWSSWLYYASWGHLSQSSYDEKCSYSPVKAYQDAIEIENGKTATAFRVKVIYEGDASENSLHSLHVYLNSDKNEKSPEIEFASPIYLKVPGISQMALDHERAKDLCSPTSVTAAVRYLLDIPSIQAVDTAKNVWDEGFNIFGNWVFNAAEAASLLGPSWSCWVERLSGFHAIYKNLEKGFPVVVSIRGPLNGSALPYNSGHLIVVIGFDPINSKVFCMDPAFSKDEKTHVSYDLNDFVEAWSRRGKVAYVFEKH